jgi:hypothetical protein
MPLSLVFTPAWLAMAVHMLTIRHPRQRFLRQLARRLPWGPTANVIRAPERPTNILIFSWVRADE